MNKHTPGPWRLEINTAEDCEWGDRWPIIVADGYEVIGKEGLYGDIQTDIANARLIAAAPELLDALQGLLRGIFDGPDEANAAMLIAKARDAINKATGEKE